MSIVIDFHAHAFPEEIAGEAIPALAEVGNVNPCLDGRLDSLLDAMDKSGIEKSDFFLKDGFINLV